MSWIQTFTGRRIYPLEPAASVIELGDIAHALAMKCRFTGHTRRFYSVAEHSLLVEKLVRQSTSDPEILSWALLHDAAEAYLPDVARPIKDAAGFWGPWSSADGIPIRQWMTFKQVENRILEAIAIRFGLSLPVPALIKEADIQLLVDEGEYLLGGTHNWNIEWTDGRKVRPRISEIDCLDPLAAEVRFLERWGELEHARNLAAEAALTAEAR